MNREDLRVGDVWKYRTTDDEYEILFIGKHKAFIKNLKSGFECTELISELSSRYSPKPKEPKVLGRLYMCVKDYEIDGAKWVRGDLCNSFGDELVNEFIPVTINEKGEVLEVVGDYDG